MTLLPRIRGETPSRSLGRLRSGVPGPLPLREGRTTPAGPPEKSYTIILKNKFGLGELRGYRFGPLIFWDQNGDRVFRRRHGDFITNRQKIFVRRQDPRVKEVLDKIGVRYLRQIADLPQAARDYQIKTGQVKQSLHKDLLKKRTLKKLEELEEAIAWGDYQEFTRKLSEVQVLISQFGVSFTPEFIETMKNRTRMQYHLRQAALFLAKGRADIALMDLRWARDYANELGVQWDEETIADALQEFLPDPLSQESLRDALQRLEETPP